MEPLDRIVIAQLAHLYKGKVREVYEVDDERLLIAATDRISAFDSVLDTPIPDKGAVLNQLAGWWFERCADIVPNHLVEGEGGGVIDPNLSLVRRAEPIRLEMIVRGYVCGSMWRKYARGERTFSGQRVADGLVENGRLPEPLVNPTTKEASDREIAPDEIVSGGWASAELYQEMRRGALALFERGGRLLAERGIILVDTKYEFGLVDGALVLIDEIHTPDSSRFWDAEAYARDPKRVAQLDKEFVRRWLMANRTEDGYPGALPADVIAETSRRYRDIYARVTGQPFTLPSRDPHARVTANLVRAGLIKDGLVVLIMGSPADVEHCRKIEEILARYDVATELRVVSAHKNGEELPELATVYNHMVEPGAVIAVAGLSNGLGGALAANLNLPVVSCPPFKDKLDMLVNINSSLMMPSKTPAGTVVRADSAALFALRALNLPRLKRRFNQDIHDVKAGLRAADRGLRRFP